MAFTISELVEQATLTDEARLVATSSVRPGGVDPLGLRQINFGLMDRVLPNLNNVARHIRPYVLMAWAWRRVRHLLERDKRLGATDQSMRDFVDRIEAIYAWSQFLRDGRADIPGAQAMRPLLEAEQYRFGGEAWIRRRDMRRYSTGFISALNYGPSLRTMGWLLPVDGAAGVFQPDPALDPLLNEFEKLMSDELDHPAFNKFDTVVVARADAERWGKIWALEKPLKEERRTMFARLGGALANTERQAGIALVRAAYADLEDDDADIDEIRARMADVAAEWNSSKPPAAADAWRQVQVRQVFRLALESLFHWAIGALDAGPMHSAPLADNFLEGVEGRLPSNAGQWILASGRRDNPRVHLEALQVALRDPAMLPAVIVQALRHCLSEAPSQAMDFEGHDRLPLARARKEAEQWAALSPQEFMVRVFEVWVMAQHAYWCVGRGLADARNRGKTILRLRIVMDEGGWTLTPGTFQGNPPEPTPDRLGTAISLLRECRKL